MKLRPLKITVIQLPDLSADERDTFRLLLNKAVEHFDRWHDVEIRINCPNYIALVPDFPTTLQRLSLLNMDIFPISLVPDTILSRLKRRVTMVGNIMVTYVIGSPFERPRSNVDLLELEDTTVTIQSLRTLELNRKWNIDLESTLRRIVLPSLAELSISIGDRYDDLPTGIDVVLQRSNARLTFLHLNNVGIDFDELYDVLRASPTLQTLCMTNCTGADVIGILIIPSQVPEKDILCPVLSKMSFSGWHIENTDDADRFVDMVELRWKFVRSRNRLAILSVDLVDCLNEGVEFSSSRSKALTRCISEGLKYKSTSF